MAGYGSDEGLAAWATANGYTLPDSPSPAVLRQRGSDYVDGLYGARFPGYPTDGVEQERAWPRDGATVFGASIGDTVIPVAVINASYAAAYYEALNPGKLSVVTSPTARVKRRKVDVIETEFFEPGDDTSAAPILSTVEGLLSAYLISADAYGPAIFVV